jgi:tetratricopeptide (TPR) repeat protein
MIRATSFMVVVLSLCSLELGCSRSAESYLEKGKRLQADGKYAEAFLNYRNSIRTRPNLGETHYRLGLVELQMGHLATGLQELHRGVELAPDLEEMRVQAGDAALAIYSSDPRKSQILYDQVKDTADYLLSRNPNSFDGLRLRGDVLCLDGKFDEAIALFRTAHAAKPGDPSVVLPMVQALFRLNESVEGENLSKAFLQRRPDFGPVYDVLFRHYMQGKRTGEAEAVLKSKLANLPKDPQPILQLAALYRQLGRQGEMSQTLHKILDNPKDFPQGHLLAGDFYGEVEQWQEARKEYSEGLRSDSNAKLIYEKKIARCLIGLGKPREAIEELNQVLKENSGDFDARMARAILLRDTRDPKDLDLAISEFNAVIASNPRNEVARYNLGLAYLSKGDPKSAQGQLVESAKLQRNYAAPRLALAELAQKNHNYSEAIQDAEEILVLNPANAGARLWKCAGLLGNKAYPEARRELNALLKDYPASIEANLYMAVLDGDEKKYPEAEARYLRFYRPGQTDLRPLEGLIQLYEGQKQVEKSLKLLEGELKLAPDSKPVHLLLAATAARAGKLDMAIEQYKWLQSKDPGFVGSYASLGDIYRAKGDISGALASYQKAREIAPNDPKVIAMVAYLEGFSGQNKEAIASLQRQLTLEPEDATAMNNLAFALAESGSQLDQALELAGKARRKAPNNPGIADTLGWVYVKRGLNDSAVQIFSGLIKKYPDEPAFRYHLGVALLQQGKRSEAKTQLDLGLSKRPPKDMAEKIKDLVAKLG